MEPAHQWLALAFTAVNAIRALFYVPQIVAVARSTDGARDIRVVHVVDVERQQPARRAVHRCCFGFKPPPQWQQHADAMTGGGSPQAIVASPSKTRLKSSCRLPKMRA